MIMNYNHVSTSIFYSAFSIDVDIGDEMIAYSVPCDLTRTKEYKLEIVSDWRLPNYPKPTGEI